MDIGGNCKISIPTQLLGNREEHAVATGVGAVVIWWRRSQQRR
jgi:hypothetical protein